MNGQQLSLLFPILLIFVFYFLLIRPQKKREKEVKEMRNNLRIGDRIITIGGISGKILKIKDDKITIEIGSDKTKLDMMRWAISSLDQPSKVAPEKSKKKVEDKPELVEEDINEPEDASINDKKED